MDDKTTAMLFEFSDMLLKLSNISNKLAKSLSKETASIQPTITLNPPISQEQWPIDEAWPIHPSPNTEAILEVYSQTRQPMLEWYKKHNHIPITNQFKTDIIGEVSVAKGYIYNSIKDVKQQYPTIIIHESLEFVDEPASVLADLKRCLTPDGKMYIRFRPWTSISGGFQEKSYAHLISNLATNELVKFKAITPLATYETMFRRLGLNVFSRNISHVKFAERFRPLIPLIIARNYAGVSILPNKVVEILEIECVDYVISL